MGILIKLRKCLVRYDIISGNFGWDYYIQAHEGWAEVFNVVPRQGLLEFSQRALGGRRKGNPGGSPRSKRGDGNQIQKFNFGEEFPSNRQIFFYPRKKAYF